MTAEITGTLPTLRYTLELPDPPVPRSASPGAAQAPAGTAQIVVFEDRATGELAAALAAATERVEAAGYPSDTRLWVRHVVDGDDDVAAAHGFSPYRDLWQLRCPLPRPQRSNLPTRAFTSADIDEFVTVNNRAFHWHPEQGGLTAASVRSRMREPWFDADGFRLYHHKGRLAGYCWTKIHRHASGDLGEIYVIAVDPDFHGRGLGGPMTLAGLEWLAEQGLTTSMLYVESDNHAANAVYRRLGFAHHHTDRAYRRHTG